MGSMSVKDADERFTVRTKQVLDLTEELTACFATAPQTAEMDRLLAQARVLLDVLAKDMDEITKDLGPNYDLGQFEALKVQIQQVLDTTTSIPLIYLYRDVVSKLPVGWQPVKGTGKFQWYRGTSIDNGLKVLEVKRFDSNYTSSGAYFGVGTYFTVSYDVAEKYVLSRHGSGCVFGMNIPGLRILKARHFKDLPSTAVPTGWQRIGNVEFEGSLADLGYDAPRRFRDSANVGQTLTKLAKEAGYQAVEFLESNEGHLLVVLIDLPLTTVEVVFITF